MGKNKTKRTPQQNPPPCPSPGPSASTRWHVHGERPWGLCSALPLCSSLFSRWLPLLFSGAAMRRQRWARCLPTQGAQAGGLGRCSTPKLSSHDSSVALLREGDNGPQAQNDEALPTVPSLSLHRQDAHLPSLQNGSHLGLSSVREWPMPHCQHRPARAQGWVWSNNNKNAVKKPKHDFKWDGPSRVGVSLATGCLAFKMAAHPLGHGTLQGDSCPWRSTPIPTIPQMLHGNMLDPETTAAHYGFNH